MTTAVTAPATVELRVDGMSCGACAARVERALSALPGTSAEVNLATAHASVRLTGESRIDDVISAINDLGYRSQILSSSCRSNALPEKDRLPELVPRLMVALALCAPVADLSISMGLSPGLQSRPWQWAVVVLALPLVTWCPWPFYRAALAGARHGVLTMDTLISLGVFIAAVWSASTFFLHRQTGFAAAGVQALWRQPHGATYLDVAAGITTVALAGRVIEALARRRAGKDLWQLISSVPRTATLVTAAGELQQIEAADLQPGDRFSVTPGNVIPADGCVLSGRASVDTQSMTGESIPITRETGDDVLGGTVVLDGNLLVSATRTGSESRLAQLVMLVERAQTAKASAQRLADRVSAVFVPAVMVTSLATLIGWSLAGARPGKAGGAALAVLLVACPCALGLATPVALLVAGGVGARLGLVLKDQQALETARSVEMVVFDKTGTLTAGRFAVRAIATAAGATRRDVLRFGGAVETCSEHPLAQAVAAEALCRYGTLPEVDGFWAAPGRGVGGVVSGSTVVVGSRQLFRDRKQVVPTGLAEWQDQAEAQGQTTLLVAVDGTAVGAISLSDEVRPTAPGVVHALQRRGIATMLLTGDSEPVARAVANAVGITDVKAGVLPHDKAQVVSDLAEQGVVVAMVGDGVNDGPALAAAHLGIAVATGTPLAAEAASIVLTRDDLGLLLLAIQLAKSAFNTIRTNLTWAFTYNLVAIPLAISGCITPVIASAAMALSSSLVVLNSFRLRRVAGSAAPKTAASLTTCTVEPAVRA